MSYESYDSVCVCVCFRVLYDNHLLKCSAEKCKHFYIVVDIMFVKRSQSLLVGICLHKSLDNLSSLTFSQTLAHTQTALISHGTPSSDSYTPLIHDRTINTVMQKNKTDRHISMCATNTSVCCVLCVYPGLP